MGVVAYLLAENGSYLVQEDGGRLDLEPLQYIVVADAGAYTIAGQSAIVAKNRTLVAEHGEYSLSGQDASIVWNRVLYASVGGYSVNGQAADIKIGGFPIPSADNAVVKLRSFTERRRF